MRILPYRSSLAKVFIALNCTTTVQTLLRHTHHCCLQSHYPLHFPHHLHFLRLHPHLHQNCNQAPEYNPIPLHHHPPHRCCHLHCVRRCCPLLSHLHHRHYHPVQRLILFVLICV